jgi:stage II sporulation protein GA (sporulation sigma-E factor processing peptidase)
VIYVDILLAINLAVNYLLLFAAARLSGSAFSRLRGILGAAVGAAYSLILLVEVPPVWMVVSKFAVSAVMVRAAAGRGSFLRYLKMLALFYGAGFVFAGAMTAFALLFRPDSFFLRNGILYYEIPPGTLVVYACAAFAATELLRRLTERGVSQGVWEAQIVFRGKSVRVKGFFDSGCCLADPFSDAPVAVCRPETLAEILPPEYQKAAADPCAGIPEGGRLVPAKSLAGSSMLLCFRPEEVFLRRSGKRYRPEELLNGLSAGAPAQHPGMFGSQVDVVAERLFHFPFGGRVDPIQAGLHSTLFDPGIAAKKLHTTPHTESDFGRFRVGADPG